MAIKKLNTFIVYNHTIIQSLMKTLITLLLLFCGIASYAQDNYKEGYIITLKKDTVWGFVKVQSDVNAVSKCYFKATEKDSAEMFRIGFLNGYGFTKGNKDYVNHIIEFEGGGTHRGYFERLASGKITLYYYINEIEGNTTYYLFEKEGEKPVYITNKRTEIGKSEFKDGIFYKKKLRNIFHDCPSLSGDIDNALFRKSDFSKITKEYNKLMETLDNI